MSLLHLLILLVIAGISGSIAMRLAGHTHGGCLAAIALGFIGALLGHWLSGLLGLPELIPLQIGGQPFPLVWSIIGAALFAALLGLLTGRRK